MSELGRVTCLTIVAESLIEDRLLRMLSDCGAQGWTVTMAQGHGPSSHAVSGIEGGNVRIETLVPASVAQRLWERLETDFFPHYAVTAWAYDVQVARLTRFG